MSFLRKQESHKKRNVIPANKMSFLRIECHSCESRNLIKNGMSFLRKQESHKAQIKMKQYYTYIMASKKNGLLYVGVTNDIIKRTYEHREGIVDGTLF